MPSEYTNWDGAIEAAGIARTTVDRLLPPPGTFSDSSDSGDALDDDEIADDFVLVDAEQSNVDAANVDEDDDYVEIAWNDESGIQGGEDSDWSLVDYSRRKADSHNRAENAAVSPASSTTSGASFVGDREFESLFLDDSDDSDDDDESYQAALSDGTSSDTGTVNTDSTCVGSTDSDLVSSVEAPVACAGYSDGYPSRHAGMCLGTGGRRTIQIDDGPIASGSNFRLEHFQNLASASSQYYLRTPKRKTITEDILIPLPDTPLQEGSNPWYNFSGLHEVVKKRKSD